MGHLIRIFQYITTCISNSDQIGALIESNLNNNENGNELENWKLITNQENGELIKELELQNKMLANCDAHESYNNEFNISLPKEFNNDNICANIDVDYEMDYDTIDEKFKLVSDRRKILNRRKLLGSSLSGDDYNSLSLSKEYNNDNLCSDIFGNYDPNMRDCLVSSDGNNDMDIGIIGDSGSGNDNDNDDQNHYNQNSSSSSSSSDKLVDHMVRNLQRDLRVWGGGLYNNDNDDSGPLNITINPWGTDPFSSSSSSDNNHSTNGGFNEQSGSGWVDFSSNFADFDAHFDTFISDLGKITTTTTTTTPTTSQNFDSMKFDNDDKDEFNKKFNNFAKHGFDDNDDFELSFKNAKNLDMMKKDTENIAGNNDNHNDLNRDNNNTGDHNEPKNDDGNNYDKNKENIECQNPNDRNDNESKFAEAEFSQITPSTAVTIPITKYHKDDDDNDFQAVGSSTNIDAINKDNNTTRDTIDKSKDENEKQILQQEELPSISTSNGPITSDNKGNNAHGDCTSNKSDL